jgi:3'-5' exoribonuclease
MAVSGGVRRGSLYRPGRIRESLPDGRGLFKARPGRYTARTMAERTFIHDLRPGATVSEDYFLTDKQLRTSRNGDLYITCTLSDKTGRLPARMWQASESMFAGLPAEGFVHAKVRCEEYRSMPQLIIEAMRPVPDGKVELGDFLATSPRDPEEMWAELLEILRRIRNRPVQLLIKQFVSDEAFVEAFKTSPAAMNMHHPYLAGLLEHTLNIARCAEKLLPMYPRLNADLVYASIFLHDAAKTAELTDGPGIGYTDRGQLVGHITMGAVWIEQRARDAESELGHHFPQTTIDLLQHILLAHHGVHEFGSPKLPMVPEAFFLHYLDNLDAKMFMTTRLIEDDPDPNAAFTGWNNQLQARLYKHAAELEE